MEETSVSDLEYGDFVFVQYWDHFGAMRHVPSWETLGEEDDCILQVTGVVANIDEQYLYVASAWTDYDSEGINTTYDGVFKACVKNCYRFGNLEELEEAGSDNQEER